ncbi:MAG: DUF3179 domain-containing (seleno)protein, partial [bacterium]|nr:DUF3179 domain-containing (seleno)protein [bacterium]
VPLLLRADLACARMPSSYRELARHGIVSGFGLRTGDPAAMINRIAAIDAPHYVDVDKVSLRNDGLRNDGLRNDDLCVGVQRQGVWHFAPLFVLTTHEIVNHDDAPALAYCPLAGLSVAIEGRTYISGLLRWDAFVLYDTASRALILPFDQRSLEGEQEVALQPLELLSFAGIRHKFPSAKILSPTSHPGNRATYGSYPSDARLGLGHAKPGVRSIYDPQTETVHPKEHVLIVGTATHMLKAYPFSALATATASGRTTLTDHVQGVDLVLSYDPEFRHARVEAAGDSIKARAFSYYFALRQHLPDLPVYCPPD